MKTREATPPEGPAPDGWRCPDCGRRFRQLTREHSCDITTLESHLSRTSEEVRATFRAIQGVLDTFGPYRLTPLKTMLTLSAETTFGGVRVTRTRLELGLDA